MLSGRYLRDVWLARLMKRICDFAVTSANIGSGGAAEGAAPSDQSAAARPNAINVNEANLRKTKSLDTEPPCVSRRVAKQPNNPRTDVRRLRFQTFIAIYLARSLVSYTIASDDGVVRIG